MKYIVMKIEMRHGAFEYAFIFPDDVVHAEMAQSVVAPLARMTGAMAKPVSAGFISMTTEGWRCFGKSESLHLESRPEDNDLLRLHLKRHVV